MSAEPRPDPLASLASAGLEKGRLEALTDGIMAVAMTLLVLDLKFDGTESIATDADLILHLLSIEKTFSVYLISFVVLGMYWIAHHVQFHYVRRTDRGLLWINLIFMLLVTLIPFTTSIMIRYESLSVPIMLYGVNLLLLSLALVVNLRYVIRRPQLAEPTLTPEIAGYLQRRLLLFSLIPALSILFAFFSTRLALYTYLVMAIVHFLPKSVDRHVRKLIDHSGH